MKRAFSFTDMYISVVVVVILTTIVLGFINDKKIDKYKEAIDKLNRQQTELTTFYNDKVGEYTTTVANISESLKNERDLTKNQQETIKALEKTIRAKTNEIGLLTMAIDTLKANGNAIVIVKGDTLVYSIKEDTLGVNLEVNVEHPSGKYDVFLAHNPIELEIYMLKDKMGQRVGAIRFIDAPWLSLKRWEVYTDPDTRAWYQRIWDNINLRIGAFAGNDQGVFGTIGYGRVNIGHMYSDNGGSVMFGYDIKE